MRGKPLESVAERVDRITKTGDLSLALDPAAERATRRLARSLRHDDSYDIQAWYMLGMIRWYRHAALKEGPDGAEHEAAVQALTPCFVAGMDVPKPLLPEVAEAAASAATGMLQRAIASPDPAVISEVTKLWQRIVAATPAGHPRREDYESALRLAARVRDGQPGRGGRHGRGDRGNAGSSQVRPGRSSRPGRALTNLAMIRGLNTSGPVIQRTWNKPSATHRMRSIPPPPTTPVRAMTLANLATTLRPDTNGPVIWRTWSKASLPHGVRSIPPPPAIRPGRHAVQPGWRPVDPVRRCGDPADLQEAVDVGRRVESAPADDPRRAAMLFSLATALEKKYEQSGNPADLEEAISTGREAVESSDARDPKLSARLSSLSMSLRRRFDLTGDLGDLEEAVSTGRDAVNLACR